MLEVDFGPGVAVELLAKRAAWGRVASVDSSAVMLRQATPRNRLAIREGRVGLQLGTVSDLSYPDAMFTKAGANHSLYFWPSAEERLRELRRVLESDARLVPSVRMRRAGASRFDPSRYGLGIGRSRTLSGWLGLRLARVLELEPEQTRGFLQA